MTNNQNEDGSLKHAPVVEAIDDKMLELQLNYLNREEEDYTTEAWFAYLRGALSMAHDHPLARMAIEFLLHFAESGEPSPYPIDEIDEIDEDSFQSYADPEAEAVEQPNSLVTDQWFLTNQARSNYGYGSS